jgi:hypothetical protein
MTTLVFEATVRGKVVILSGLLIVIDVERWQFSAEVEFAAADGGGLVRRSVED